MKEILKLSITLIVGIAILSAVYFSTSSMMQDAIRSFLYTLGIMIVFLVTLASAAILTTKLFEDKNKG